MLVLLESLCATTSQELPTQPDVELVNTGTWFEQAPSAQSFPERLRGQCAEAGMCFKLIYVERHEPMHR